jgi:hypothetical protein
VRSPFLRPDDPRYAEILTDATFHVIGAGGLGGFSVGALARWMRVTPGAVLKSLSRAEVIELVTVTFGRRWLEWAACDRALAAALPRSDEELCGVRVHLALLELARGEEVRGNVAPARHLAQDRAEELDMLALRLSTTFARPVGPRELQATAAMVDGLRHRLAVFEPAMTSEAACSILGELVDRLADQSSGSV